jgi:hypothetical protein
VEEEIEYYDEFEPHQEDVIVDDAEVVVNPKHIKKYHVQDTRLKVTKEVEVPNVKTMYTKVANNIEVAKHSLTSEDIIATEHIIKKADHP